MEQEKSNSILKSTHQLYPHYRWPRFIVEFYIDRESSINDFQFIYESEWIWIHYPGFSLINKYRKAE